MYTRYYDPEIFVNCFEGIDRTNHIVATYFMEDELPGEDFIDHFSLIQSMTVEGSTGTWQKVAEETDEVRRMLSGKMLGYFEIPTAKPNCLLIGRLLFTPRGTSRSPSTRSAFPSFRPRASPCRICPIISTPWGPGTSTSQPLPWPT